MGWALAGVAIIDFPIGIAILIISMILFASFRWGTNLAAVSVSALPFIGPQARLLVLAFRDSVWGLARGFEQIQSTYVWNMSVRFVQLLNATVGVAFHPWAIVIVNTNNIANESRAIAWWVQGQWIPFATNWITNIGNIANEARGLVWVLGDHVFQVVEPIANEGRAIAWLLRDHVIPDLQGRVASTTQVANDAWGRANTLWQFLPLLQALLAFEGGILARAQALELEAVQQRGRIAELEKALATVLPLAVVAAIGATAVMNLERLARDPCHCLTIGDFSDLPSRIESLEGMGP